MISPNEEDAASEDERWLPARQPAEQTDDDEASDGAGRIYGKPLPWMEHPELRYPQVVNLPDEDQE